MGSGLNYTTRNKIYAHVPMEVNVEKCSISICGEKVVVWTSGLGERTLLVLDKADLSEAVWIDSNEGTLFYSLLCYFYYSLIC